MPLDPQNRAQIRDRELRVWDLTREEAVATLFDQDEDASVDDRVQ